MLKLALPSFITFHQIGLHFIHLHPTSNIQVVLGNCLTPELCPLVFTDTGLRDLRAMTRSRYGLVIKGLLEIRLPARYDVVNGQRGHTGCR
jgi:hypothetical protein